MQDQLPSDHIATPHLQGTQMFVNKSFLKMLQSRKMKPHEEHNHKSEYHLVLGFGPENHVNYMQ